MTKDELVEWAERFHYPQFVLSRTDVIRHGKEAWQHLFNSTHERIDLAMIRVERWQERVEREREGA